jgi:hypothetical protein
MKVLVGISLSLIALCGCSTVGARRQEKAAAFASMPPAKQQLVEGGQIELGMDTNAVYIAWGKPSSVSTQAAPNGSGTDDTWFYYGNRPVLVPDWAFVPNYYGYWSPEYTPRHYAVSYTKAEVSFHNGRVVSFKKN